MKAWACVKADEMVRKATFVKLLKKKKKSFSTMIPIKIPAIGSVAAEINY